MLNKSLYIIVGILILISTKVIAAEDMLKTSWEHYKRVMVEDCGRPFGDIDQNNVALGSKGTHLTYSESVSYVLFRAVWLNDRAAFDKTWHWAYENMMRKNIRVYHWQTKQWEELPSEKRDHLFAWRWAKNINNSGRDGVIYSEWKDGPKDAGWRSGYEVAPDGDQLIAGALIFAHYRWNSEHTEFSYIKNAQNILKDLWDKCVLTLTPGELDSFENQVSLRAWFTYTTPGFNIAKNWITGESHGHGVRLDANGASYVGMGKVLGREDLSEITGLTFSAKGADAVRITLEDMRGLKATLIRNLWEEDWERVVFSFSEMDSQKGFDWTQVKTIMFQTEGEQLSLDNIRLYGGKINGLSRLHLVTNDQGLPWINVSYYMPFLYDIFAKVDPNRPWKDLIDSAFYDMSRGAKATLHDSQGTAYQGNDALVPDWFMYSLTGETVDLPQNTDGYLSSWDAFRTWFFLAVYTSWYDSTLDQNILKNKAYSFFKNELGKKGMINGGYYISGKTGTTRGINNEYAGINSAYLSLFHSVGDQYYSKLLFKRIQNKYHADGYWDDNPEDYYTQNWAWFGLAFYKDKGEELGKLSLLRK